MPTILDNSWRGTGLLAEGPLPLDQVEPVADLLAKCPVHAATPLQDAPGLAAETGIAALWIKDERPRMGLGSFKALGAAYVIARAAAERGDTSATGLAGETFVTASAGNHGLSVAAGARIFGAKAVIYLAETVPEPFAQRLAGYGARVVREGAIYEESMAAAERAAAKEGWTLLSDASWEGYIDLPHRVMEGYVQMAAEAVAQVPEAPTHLLVQAGVGGMAAAVAAHARAAWGDGPQILVVEPEFAPALFESIRAGAMVTAEGPVSAMGRLDCKTPSLVALAGLSRDADYFVTITEEEAAQGIARLADAGFGTTPSGGAGLAAVLAGVIDDPSARVLTFLSEGPEDG